MPTAINSDPTIPVLQVPTADMITPETMPEKMNEQARRHKIKAHLCIAP